MDKSLPRDGSVQLILRNPVAAERIPQAISSFKCGHDAPIYGVIEGIIEQSGTAYFCFKDLDENKPSGSIRIRVETVDYFPRRYHEEVIRKRKATQDIDAQLPALEVELRRSMTSRQLQPEPQVQEMASD